MSLGIFDRRQFLQQASGWGTAIGLSPRVLVAAEAAEADEAAWLKEVQTPPATIPAKAPVPSNFFTDDTGKPIADLKSWLPMRAKLKQQWLDFLGPFPAKRNSALPPKLTIVSSETVAEVVRQLVRYEVEPGISTEAYLCSPAKALEQRAGESGRRPGVVVFHSTVNHSIEQPAGLQGAPEFALGMTLAQEGWVAFCPRNFLWSDNLHFSGQAEAAKFLARQPLSKGMAKMLYDALVAVDILAALPEVDDQRLSAVGHSLGAKEVLYLAALDERICCTVSSEGGIGLAQSNWEAAWYLGPAIQAPDFTWQHDQLLALAAPRPFLVLGGNSADGDATWPLIASALPAYRLYDPPARLGLYTHSQGHAIPPTAAQRLLDWLKRYG